MNTLTHKRENYRSQKGSVVIHVAIFLSFAVILFIGTELGYLFYLKREFQKTADLAALAGAQALNANNCTTAFGAARSNANDGTTRNMPATYSLTDADMACGKWSPQDTTHANHFNELATEKNAIRVSITRTPDPLFIFFTGNRTISVQAIAARALPKAALSINSTLLTLQTGQSPVLDALVGGLLGGSINLGAVGWQGLVTSQINLLNFLDVLAPAIDLTVGDYDGILNANVTVAQLLEVMASVLERNGALLTAEIREYKQLAILAAALKLPPIRVGDALGVVTGTAASALDLSLQAAQLTQALVQLANSQVADPSAVLADVVLPIAGVTATVKIIEPPQFSAVGNPELAKAAPLGPNKIYVRTSQIRTLVSVDIGREGQLLTGLISGLSNALQSLSTTLIAILSSVIDLAPPECPLIDTVCQTSPKPTILDVLALPLPIRLDVSLDISSAAAYIDNYDCSNPSDNKLLVNYETNIAILHIGKMGVNAEDAKEKVFASNAPLPKAEPVPLLDVGTVVERSTCPVVALGLCVGKYSEYLDANGNWTKTKANAKRTAFGGGGIGISVNPPPLKAKDTPLNFHSNDPGLLKEIGESNTPTQKYISVSATDNITGPLIDIINGIELNLYSPSASTGLLGGILETANKTVTAVFGLLRNLIAPLLKSVINPLIGSVLKNLGIDLVDAQVGARLSCKAGAELVH